MSHYIHLTAGEGEKLLKCIAEGKTIQETAREMKRSASTISREIKRTKKKEEYSHFKAEANYYMRRKRSGHQRIFLVNPEAKTKVRELFLERHWLPEQISNRLKLEVNLIQVNYNTIYRGIYSHGLEEGELPEGQRGMAHKLRHHVKTRHKKGTQERRWKIQISHPIEERPEEGNQRNAQGNWKLILLQERWVEPA